RHGGSQSLSERLKLHPKSLSNPKGNRRNASDPAFLRDKNNPGGQAEKRAIPAQIRLARFLLLRQQGACMVTRRLFLSSLGLGAAGLATTAAGQAQRLPVIGVDLRGSIDAAAHGIRPGAGDRKSKAFAKLLREAA